MIEATAAADIGVCYNFGGDYCNFGGVCFNWCQLLFLPKIKVQNLRSFFENSKKVFFSPF